MSSSNREGGFIVLMGMLMLVLGTAVWFGTLGQVRSNTMKLAKDDQSLLQLMKIKEKMLSYAVMQPEIFSDQDPQPGIGYFPCPDVDGDGVSDNNCGYNLGVNQLFVIGKVPNKIAARNFSFLDSLQNNDLYWFAVDSRYVDSSAYYSFNTSSRFAPLNPDLPITVQDSGHHDVPPLLVDGRDEIVVVLFYAGEALSGQARPSNSVSDYLEQPAMTSGLNVDFASVGSSSSTFNDYVITITREEWLNAMLSRASQDISPQNGIADLCETVTDGTQHWFNACSVMGVSRPVYTCDDTYDNLAGQNWRGTLCQ